MQPTVGFMTHVTCRLTAKNRISSGTLRWVVEYGLPFLLTRCYVGLVTVDVQEQAEDKLVPPLLQNCFDFE